MKQNPLSFYMFLRTAGGQLCAPTSFIISDVLKGIESISTNFNFAVHILGLFSSYI